MQAKNQEKILCTCWNHTHPYVFDAIRTPPSPSGEGGSIVACNKCGNTVGITHKVHHGHYTLPGNQA